jgi:hypothetical protein
MNYKSFLHKRVEGNPIEPLLNRLVDYFLDKNYSTSASVAYVAAANHLVLPESLGLMLVSWQASGHESKLVVSRVWSSRRL